MNRRRVNGKALLILTLSAAALVAATHFGHAFQVKRNARALFEQAEQAEREGQPGQAAHYLEQYLWMAPDDADARARYGLLLTGQAKTAREKMRAWLVLEEVVRRDPARADARRQAAELALLFGRTAEARDHLTILLRDTPDDADLLWLKGVCEQRAGKADEAAECFVRAGQLAPQRVDLCAKAAAALRELPQRRPDAAAVIDQMVQAAPRSAPARLAAARYYVQAGDWPQADREVRFALESLHGQDAELSLLAAEVALAGNRTDEARGHLERGLAAHPDDRRLRRLLARVELTAGRREKAAQVAAPLADAESAADPRELWSTAALLIDLGQTDRATEVVHTLEGRGGAVAAAMAGCLRGQLLARRGAWGQARVVLEKAQAASQVLPELNLRATLLLAECYGRQGNVDQQLIASAQAVKLDPASPAARRGHAAALAAAGKSDEAITEYRALVAAAPDVRMDLARLLLVRTRTRPPAERDWSDFDRVLAEMPAADRDTPAVRLLRCDALLAQGKLAEARKLLEAERDRDPKQVRPWAVLIALADRDKSADAAALLAEAERQTGWQVEWELVKASRAVRAGADAAKQLLQIEAGAGKCPDADRGRLLAGLAEAYLAAGDRADARRLLRQAADRAADDLPPRFALFELAVQDRDEAEAARLRDEVRRVEGPGGPTGALCEASCHLFAAFRGDKAALAAARQALARAAEQRPTWSRVAILDGELCELEGRPDKALEKYQEALDRGDGRLALVRRVLQLLYEQRRYADAHALLRKLPEPVVAQTDLGRIAAQLLAVSPEDAGADPAAARARALQLARRAVPADSTDYRGHLWVGQLAVAAGQPAEAERAFRRAVELADTAPETWVTLALFLAKADPKKAEAELDRAKGKLPKDQVQLALAPCYEALGKTALAEEQYKAALAAKPTDPAVLRAVATFFARTGQSAKAVPVLRTLIDPGTKAPEATVAWARRALAVSLPVMGNYHQFRDALTLIDANGGTAAEDRLAKALLLATQPAHRKEAIGLFETLPARKDALPADARFLLAQLYEADGDWPKARAHLLALVNEHDQNPVYLVGLVRALLRHDAAGDAKPYVDKLAALRPDAYETAELKARVLKADGRAADAAAVVRAFAAPASGGRKSPGSSETARLALAAGLLEEFGRTDEAEALYREYAATAGRPEAALVLADFLARTGRTADALALCGPAWQTCPPEAVARSGVLAVRGHGAEDQRRQVERWLTDAIAKHPQSVMLPVLLAELYDSTGRHDEAIALYRRILQASPGNVVALNNLAYLLALRGTAAEEAVALINRAIDTAGPNPELLDSRAVIYLKAGQTDLAVKDIRQAVAQAPTPVKYYHLAAAERAANNRSAAGDALRKAIDDGLKPADLHPLEQAGYRQLADQLGGG